MNNKKTVFITGATGLLGSYLLKILLENGHKVYALARNKDENLAKDRILEVLKFWDEKKIKYSDNLTVFTGDITQNNLGLDEKSTDLLKNETEEIFHCAAAIQFNLPINKIRKVNVEGTERILNFALECKNLKKLNHISSAYICGDYKGVFKEDDLDVGQRFPTTYEQTKFEAEKLVRNYRKHGIWIDVFRPPVVIGDSITGKTLQFKHMYQFLHICSSEIFDILPSLDGSIYLVPIDTMCKAIYLISTSVAQKNNTYYPFGQEAVSFQYIFDTAAKELKFKRATFIKRSDFDLKQLTPTKRALLLNNIFYINTDVKFIFTTTYKILSQYNFYFPIVDENLLKKIIRYAASVKFLKNYF